MLHADPPSAPLLTLLDPDFPSSSLILSYLPVSDAASISIVCSAMSNIVLWESLISRMPPELHSLFENYYNRQRRRLRRSERHELLTDFLRIVYPAPFLNKADLMLLLRPFTAQEFSRLGDHILKRAQEARILHDNVAQALSALHAPGTEGAIDFNKEWFVFFAKVQKKSPERSAEILDFYNTQWGIDRESQKRLCQKFTALILKFSFILSPVELQLFLAPFTAESIVFLKAELSRIMHEKEIQKKYEEAHRPIRNGYVATINELFARRLLRDISHGIAYNQKELLDWLSRRELHPGFASFTEKQIHDVFNQIIGIHRSSHRSALGTLSVTHLSEIQSVLIELSLISPAWRKSLYQKYESLHSSDIQIKKSSYTLIVLSAIGIGLGTIGRYFMPFMENVELAGGVNGISTAILIFSLEFLANLREEVPIEALVEYAQELRRLEAAHSIPAFSLKTELSRHVSLQALRQANPQNPAPLSSAVEDCLVRAEGVRSAYMPQLITDLLIHSSLFIFFACMSAQTINAGEINYYPAFLIATLFKMLTLIRDSRSVYTTLQRNRSPDYYLVELPQYQFLSQDLYRGSMAICNYVVAPRTRVESDTHLLAEP